MSDVRKITIITPSYNQGKYIEQTILSVLNQNYPNLEYIIIDGGSTDDTIDIIRKHASNISYCISESDKGQSDAINKGFKVATGDIINWLNSDDYLAPGSLQKIADAFTALNIKAITSAVHNFDETGNSWDELTPINNTGIEYIAKAFNNQPGTFFRREVWDRYFPLPAQLHYTMDQYLWFCFWMEYDVSNFKIENFISAYFRRHASSKTSASLNDKIFNHLGKDFFNEHNLIFWSYFNQQDPLKAMALASYFSDDYNYRDAVIAFPPHLRFNPGNAETLFHLYLFELIKEDYRHGFLERFKKNAENINNEYLSADDKVVLKKMKVKTISPGIIKAYRSVYWKINSIFGDK